MRVWALAAVGVVFATTAHAGPCTHNKPHNCAEFPATVNFSSLSDISSRIVSEEKIDPRQLKNPAEIASPPYTGPMIGVNPRPGRTPTVGYYWSLE